MRHPRATQGVLFVLLALLLAGCAAPAEPLAPADLPASAPEPLVLEASATGAPLDAAFEVQRLLYDFGESPFVNPEEPAVYPTRLRGVIHAPVGEGPFPVLLFQHGRHSTCATPAGEFLLPLASRCPSSPLVEPVDSYQGYDYLAEELARRGIFVASVDANDVNDFDGFGTRTKPDAGAAARAHILLSTLDELQRLHETSDDLTWGDRFTGKLDLGRVGLMGHSRGGEGVTYTVVANAARPEAERHALKAVFALAPIDATRVQVEGVAWATLLPYCDGDVSSLSGARFYDDSRDVQDGFLRTQILVMGANHNFYNTKWTQDDAAWLDEDEHCGGDARLSPEEQRAEGVAHIGSFFRLHLLGEAAFAPLFDGRALLPAEACPARLDCGTLAHVSATSSARLLVADAPKDGVIGATLATCAPPDCEGSFTPGSAERSVMAWSAPGASLAVPMPAGPADVSRFAALVVRLGIDAGRAANAGLSTMPLSVSMVDASGAVATVDAAAYSRALFATPGGKDARKVVLNDVRLPLAAFEGVDLAHVASLRLAFSAPQGEVHLADVAFHP